MTRIVTYAHRYKRPPRKRTKTAAIEGPVIVTGKSSRRPADGQVAAEVISRSPGVRAGAAQPSTVIDASRDRTVTEGKKREPTDDDRKSAIVTARSPGKRYVDVPEEEHRRVGDLADAMFQR